MKKQNSIWIGSQLGSNKPVNFFKSNSKAYHTNSLPVDMFKDNDKDGVSNVFDCQPNNKNKQGFIDAVLGASKALFSKGGNVRQAYTEGMAMKGNAVSRAYKKRQQSKYQNLSPPARPQKAETPEQKANRIMIARIQAQDMAAKQRAEKEFRQNVSGVPGMQASHRLFKKIQMAHPNYQREMKKQYWQQRLKDPKLTPQQRSKIQYQMAKAANVRSNVVTKFRTRAIEMAFPVTSMSAYGSGAAFKTIQGVPGRGRGRPRGSLDRRYAAYGGVFGYRRFLSEQRKIARARLQQQQMMMKQQRIPQYEQQQYQQQVSQQEQQLPPELQGQGVTPEYSQFQQEQAQMQQVPQQVQYEQPQQYQQPQPQQQEIRTPFKSSGGSPYPPVPRQGLTPSRQTIQQGYVESVDAFTGRRFMKQLPKTERWAGSQ